MGLVAGEEALRSVGQAVLGVRSEELELVVLTVDQGVVAALRAPDWRVHLSLRRLKTAVEAEAEERGQQDLKGSEELELCDQGRRLHRPSSALESVERRVLVQPRPGMPGTLGAQEAQEERVTTDQ
jgi:hypothetical protein